MNNSQQADSDALAAQQQAQFHEYTPADQDGDDDDGDEGAAPSAPQPQQGKGTKPVKRAGRRKINIEFIKDKSRRHITFSKRKAGIMKKAYELSTLTGTQVLLLVASETGHVYTFATPKLQPLITKTEGKNLIQACLNSPDPIPDQHGDDQTQQVPAQTPQGYQHHGGNSGHEQLEDDRKPKKIKTELKTTQYQPQYHAAPSPQQAQPPQQGAMPGYDMQPAYAQQMPQQHQQNAYPQHMQNPNFMPNFPMAGLSSPQAQQAQMGRLPQNYQQYAPQPHQQQAAPMGMYQPMAQSPANGANNAAAAAHQKMTITQQQQHPHYLPQPQNYNPMQMPQQAQQGPQHQGIPQDYAPKQN